MPTIWRINIKPAASKGVNPRTFCIDRRILGVGWHVGTEENYDWDTYSKLATKTYYDAGDKGWWPAVNAIKNKMRVNDLCWTRDRHGVYYLGRITSDWMYRGGQEYRDADIANVRECDWQKVGEVDVVPGKVLNSFIPRRTVQSIWCESVSLYSQFLYNERSSSERYTLPTTDVELFSLISAEDCEDIVGAFLQEKGYRIIPSSCKTDTAAYEYVLKHSETGESAVVQVKQGCIDLSVAEYSEIPGNVYLFTTQGKYIGPQSHNVHCIDPNEIKEFVFANRHLLSNRLNTWITMIDRFAQKPV